ncbi:MAG: acetyl-coenzyme A synthetase N-terminal domain-containing protein [Pirellulaceae bacterium]
MTPARRPIKKQGKAVNYQQAYNHALHNPVGFWGDAAADIQWDKKGTVVLDVSRAPFHRWFPGGQLNTCHNALDWHVANGRGHQSALIYDSPLTNTIKTFTRSPRWCSGCPKHDRGRSSEAS